MSLMKSLALGTKPVRNYTTLCPDVSTEVSWASRKYEAGDSSCSCELALVGWDKVLSVYMDFFSL